MYVPFSRVLYFKRTMCSQYLSMVCLALLPLGTRMVHLPPASHLGSSHLGSTPDLKRWKSVPAGSHDGGLTLLYRLCTVASHCSVVVV